MLQLCVPASSPSIFSHLEINAAHCKDPSFLYTSALHSDGKQLLSLIPVCESQYDASTSSTVARDGFPGLVTPDKPYENKQSQRRTFSIPLKNNIRDACIQ